MLSPTKLRTATQVVGFSYPKLHTGKSWYVDFYATDPTTGELRRKKFSLDGLKKISERKRRAAEIIEAVTRRLREGWNPWVEVKESRGFTLMSDCLDLYLEYVEKKGDRYKTKMRYKSSVNILREFFVSRSVPPKYVYQLLTNNPAANIPKIRETAKIRKDLTKEMLAEMRKNLKEKDPYFLLACELEYYTFIRPNELSHLRVQDVSLEYQTIFVSGSFSKNHKDGYVGINTRICNLMIELQVLEKPGEYYLFGKNFIPNKKRSNADQYNRRWKKMREELGWSEEYQFYSLKDSGIRDLANDAGIVVARDQARHSDVSTTNRYIQVHPNDVHEATKTFEGEL